MRRGGSTKPDRLTLTAGALAAALGSLGVAAWTLDTLPLASIHPSFIPMAPSTGLGFILLGGALVLLAGRFPVRFRWIVGAIALLVTALSFLDLADFLVGDRLRLDLEAYLGPPPGSFGDVPLARMSPITALCFLLGGVALFLRLSPASNRRRADAAGLLGCTVVLIALTVILGYAYGVPLLYGTWVIPVALPTAVSFLVAGSGLIGSGGDRAFPLRQVSGTTARARLLRAFLPAVVAACLVTTTLQHSLLSAFHVNAALVAAVSTLAVAVVFGAVICTAAGVVAVAIDNAELVLRRSHAELEQLVENRTAELRHANAALETEIAERRDTERRADRARELAEKATLAKSRFLASMSHELRTPLNAIIGFSEVLEQQTFGDLNERQVRYVGNVVTSGRHLLQLINDLLDLAKIEAGRLTLDRGSVQLPELLTEVATIARGLADQKDVRFETRDDGGLPRRFIGDGPKLKQILLNLLGNAIKFTPAHGHVTLRLTHETSATGSALRFVVSDNGIGVKPEDHSRIFGEFEQADSRDLRQQGTGLGLALTRRLVELHGGRVWVESDGIPGHGSAFYVELPAAMDPTTDDFRTAPPIHLAVATREVEHPPLALIVEDDKQAAELMEMYLIEGGYRVAHAADGVDAVRTLEHVQPDVVLLDIKMPRMNGLELLTLIKQREGMKRVPVIIVSITDNRRQGLDLGADAYFTKPVDRTQLLDSIRHLLERQSTERSRVLVVDDESVTAVDLCELLRAEGYEVSLVHGGTEAVESALAQPPDMIVFDLLMPDMSGFDVIERLRSHPFGVNIPILVVSAAGTTTPRLRDLGCDVVIKPEDRDTLLMEVARLACSRGGGRGG